MGLKDYLDSDSRSKKSLSSYIEDEIDEKSNKKDKPRAISPGVGSNAEGIIRDYKAGLPWEYIKEKYGVSSGTVRSHLWAAGLADVRMTGWVQKSLSHLEEADIEKIINMYQDGYSNRAIYEQFEIHKNGLYYLLDSNGVPRKRRS